MPYREEKRGEAILRIVRRGKAFAGAVIAKGKTGAVIEGDDPQVLWAQLETMAAEASPSFFGYAGALTRFRKIFPDGFADRGYVKAERTYKQRAKDKLQAALPLEAALNWTGDGKSALSAFGGTNLLAPIENARIGEVLRSPSAAAFIRGAAMFAEGGVADGIEAMRTALKPFEIAKWTVMTYLPFLWRPDAHMFLKPEVTRDYAERVGHAFAHRYTPDLKPEVYGSLCDLAVATRDEIVDLGPADMIDVQSFIWVVGKYTEADAAYWAENAVEAGAGA